MEPVQPPATPATPAAPPAATPPAAPPSGTAPLQAPVAAVPADSFEGGGEIKPKWDMVEIGIAIFSVATLTVIAWCYISKARQSKRLANTQEGLEKKVNDIEMMIKKGSKNNYSYGLGI